MKELKKENYEKEEWGGWKIVSDMLDNPSPNGIYPTSKCYQKLYEFVMAQKKKALQAQNQEAEKYLHKALAEARDELNEVWEGKLESQNQDLLNEIKEYIREKSLLTPEDKAEIIGYLEGIRIRPKQLLK